MKFSSQMSEAPPALAMVCHFVAAIGSAGRPRPVARMRASRFCATALPFCAALRNSAAAPLSSLAMPVPLNSAMAYSTSAAAIAAARRRAEQLRGRDRVLRDAVAFLVERRERVLRLGAAGVGRAAQQLGGARDVLRQLLPLEIEQRQIVGGRHVAELGGLVEQRRSLRLVLRSAASGKARHRQREDRLAVAAVGRKREPGERLALVLRDAVAVGVEVAEQRHGDRVALFARAARRLPERREIVAALIGAVGDVALRAGARLGLQRRRLASSVCAGFSGAVNGCCTSGFSGAKAVGGGGRHGAAAGAAIDFFSAGGFGGGLRPPV